MPNSQKPSTTKTTKNPTPSAQSVTLPQKFKHFCSKYHLLTNFLVFLVIAIAAFVASLNTPVNLWRYDTEGVDRWVFQTVAYTMQNGGMPYVDTFDHKGPLLYLINFIGMNIHFSKGLWLIEIVVLFITFLMFYKTARLFCKKIPALVAMLAGGALLLFYFEGGDFTEEYAALFIAIATYFFLSTFQKGKGTRLGWIICGVCLASVCLLRLNMIALWLVFCPVIFFTLIARKDWPTLRQFFLYFCLGFLLVVLPTFIWLIACGAFTAFIDQYFLFNLQYSSNAAPENLLANRWITFIYFCGHTLTVIALLIAAWLCLRQPTPESETSTQKSPTTHLIWSYLKSHAAFLIYATYFILSLLLIAMSGQTYNHYGIILAPVIVPPLAYLFGQLAISSSSNTQNQPTSPIYNTNAFLMLIFTAWLIAPTWLGELQKAGEYCRDQDLPQIPPAVQSTINYINSSTTPEDRISVYGNMDSLYIFTNRLPASKYSYQFPIGLINPTFLDEYFADLEQTLPKVIVIEEREDYQGEAEMSRMYNFLKQNNYIKVQDGVHQHSHLITYERP